MPDFSFDGWDSKVDPETYELRKVNDDFALFLEQVEAAINESLLHARWRGEPGEWHPLLKPASRPVRVIDSETGAESWVEAPPLTLRQEMERIFLAALLARTHEMRTFSPAYERARTEAEHRTWARRLEYREPEGEAARYDARGHCPLPLEIESGPGAEQARLLSSMRGRSRPQPVDESDLAALRSLTPEMIQAARARLAEQRGGSIVWPVVRPALPPFRYISEDAPLPHTMSNVRAVAITPEMMRRVTLALPPEIEEPPDGTV